MKKYQQLGVVLVIGLGFSAAANSSVVLTDKLTGTAISGSQGIPPGWMANAFSTSTNCPNGCALGDITLKLATMEGSFEGIVLQIFSDGGLVPGAAAIGHAFINPGPLGTSTPSNYVFKPSASDASVVLADNTKYWVKIDASASNAANVDWTYAALNVPGQWAYDTLGGDEYSTGQGNFGPFLMKVEVNPLGNVITPAPGDEPGPSPVPVPAAAWLMGSGLLGLLASSRKKEV